MASSSNSVGLGNGYTLTATFEERGTPSTENNTTSVYVGGILQANGARWWSSYLSNLKVYWHDNRENYDRLVKEINISANPTTGYYDRWEASGTITVTHLDDGSLNGYAYAVFTKGGSASTAPNSGSVYSRAGDNHWTALTKIDRYPILSSAEDFTDEGNPKIKFSTALGFSGATVKTRITKSDGTAISGLDWKTISNVSAGEYTYSLTENERTALRQATPDSNTLGVRFELRTTTTGGTNYNSDPINKQMAIINATPTATYTQAETNAKVSTILGASASTVVQNASVVRFTITPTLVKNAGSITSVVAKNNNNNYNATLSSGNYIVDVPIQANSIQILVTDSRQNTLTIPITKTMIAYAPVDILQFSFIRVNSTSSDIKISLNNAKYYQATIGNVTNAPVVKYKLGDGNWVTIPSTEYVIDNTNHTISISNFLAEGILHYKVAGQFSIYLEDVLTSDQEGGTNGYVTKGVATFEAGEHDFQVNGELYIATEDREDITEIRDLIYPEGSIYMSSNNVNPETLFGGSWTSITSPISGTYAWERTY